MKKNDMKKNAAVIAVLVILAGGGGYYYWQQQQSKPQPAVAPTPRAQPAPAAVTPKPEVRPAEAAPAGPPLPQLAESDGFVLDAIAALVGNKSLMKLFYTERVIHNIVATVDNLPRERVHLSVMPLKPVPGAFVVAGADGNWTIGPRNATRYAPYMKLAEALDSKKLVELYVRLYPLFQQAYEQLGYPKGYFNDRLVEALDDLLEAPDVKGPVKLVRPNVMYLYADSELEAASAGQKILMRVGSGNAAKLKVKLREIRAEITQHVQNGKVMLR